MSQDSKIADLEGSMKTLIVTSVDQQEEVINLLRQRVQDGQDIKSPDGKKDPRDLVFSELALIISGFQTLRLHGLKLEPNQESLRKKLCGQKSYHGLYGKSKSLALRESTILEKLRMISGEMDALKIDLDDFLSYVYEYQAYEMLVKNYEKAKKEEQEKKAQGKIEKQIAQLEEDARKLEKQKQELQRVQEENRKRKFDFQPYSPPK